MTDQTFRFTEVSTNDGGGRGQSADAPPIVIEIPAPPVNPVLERFGAVVRRLPRYIFLGVNLVRDDRVPGKAKATIAVGGAYAVSPVDLVPGIIPVAGQVDDLVVLLLALRQAIRSCPPEVAADHLERAGLTRDDFEADLRAVRDTAIWLAKKGAQGAGRLAARGGRRLKALLSNR